jgi:hypothetical protein
MQDHDLDDFAAFTDEEIAAIAAFLHEERETASPVVPEETDAQEEEDIDWDGQDDIRRSDPQMIPPLTTFYLEELLKDIINGFPALQGTDEWKSAESYRRQIALVFKALHLGPINATFAEIGRLFEKSKGSNKYQTLIQCPVRRRNGYPFRLFVLFSFGVVKLRVECDLKIFTRSVCVGRFSCAPNVIVIVSMCNAEIQQVLHIVDPAVIDDPARIRIFH